jgi:hypothetical protein
VPGRKEALKTASPERPLNVTRVKALASLGCIALSTLLSIGTSGGVQAAATPSPSNAQLFGVHPVQQGSTTLPGGHFNFALIAGQRVTDGVVVENFSDHTLTVHVYGADLLTAAGGGFAPTQPTATLHEVGAWIVVSEPTLTIVAHGQATDTFTVSVPAMVSVGQHLGAVVASADAGASPQGNPIEARVALLTVVTVPGAARAAGMLTPLSVSSAAVGLEFAIALSNTGNVLLTYTAALNITAPDGRRVSTISLQPVGAYVVPGGRVPLDALWKQSDVGAGDYHAQATIVIVADGKAAGRILSQDVDLEISGAFPTVAVIAGVLVVGLVLLLAVWLTHRRRRYGRILTHERSTLLPRSGLNGG